MHARTFAGLAALLLTTSLGGAPIATPQEVVSPIPPTADETFVPDAGARCGTGILQVLGSDGPQVREFPLKHTTVDAQVSGPVSRVRVTQVFANPYAETIEAVYVFPRPHEAAVTDLEMRLGERVVRGLIEKRDAARRIYEQARASGHVAALLEQERPNIFTQSVANILPGNEIEISITYVESLEPESGTWEFAFPMVVGPRYLPPGSGPRDAVPASFAPMPPGPPPTGDERINPPFLPPSVRSGQDIELTLDLEAGVAIENLRSPTHAFVREASAPGRTRVRLHPADTIPNKDFVLRWDVDGDKPETAVLTRHDGREGWVSVVVHPKRTLAERDVTPKEMVFVLDCSGSMHGEPMAAAKALARKALLDMTPGDSFQIIRFSTQASGFSPAPVAATPANVRRGLAYLEGLSGTGGTQMIEGIRAALDYPADPNRLRIVMFLTDGYIGNENEILAAVRDKVGGARLFSFGVGSSVNRFLLEEMAREGRGEVQYQLAGSDVAEEVDKFYARIRHPYLTDVEISWSGVDVVDRYPECVPDLFEGRPLTLSGRYEGGGTGELRIRGRIAGRPWERRIAVDLPSTESGNPAIGSLWARARIADLERSMRHGEDAATVEAITNLGLAHRLVTRWTSFVAVEEKLVVSDGHPRTVRVPVDMPQGVSFEGVFGAEGIRSEAPASGMVMMQRKSSAYRSLGTAAPASPREREVTFESESESVLEESRGGATRDEDLVDRIRSAPATIDARIDAREEAAPFRALAISMTLASDTVAPNGTITLRIEFTNRGSAPVDVPAASALGLDDLGLRAVGSGWDELRFDGGGRRAVRTEKLAPGATVVREVRIPVSRLGRLATGGAVHLLLDGTRWGSSDTPLVTVRIAAS